MLLIRKRFNVFVITKQGNFRMSYTKKGFLLRFFPQDGTGREDIIQIVAVKPTKDVKEELVPKIAEKIMKAFSKCVLYGADTLEDLIEDALQDYGEFEIK